MVILVMEWSRFNMVSCYITTAEGCKMSLEFYCKATCKIPLILLRVEKTEHEGFHLLPLSLFLFFFYSSPHA